MKLENDACFQQKVFRFSLLQFLSSKYWENSFLCLKPWLAVLLSTKVLHMINLTHRKLISIDPSRPELPYFALRLNYLLHSRIMVGSQNIFSKYIYIYCLWLYNNFRALAWIKVVGGRGFDPSILCCFPERNRTPKKH